MDDAKQLNPEELARVNIDNWLDQAGWEVVNRDEITTGLQALAVREGLLEGNLEADYLLFLGGRAVGVLEAKRVEVDVLSPEVQQQALNYTHHVPSWVQVWENPLPLVYLSNGRDLYFVNQADPNFDINEPNWTRVSKIFTPKETATMLSLTGDFVKMPALTLREKHALRDCQREAVQQIEASFRIGKRRALVVIATGAGKTYTACMEAYRMLNYTNTNRVLFLVDRNNLGSQAEEEFGMFRLTKNGETFSNIFGVERLTSPSFEKDTKVVISTIQRLFSIISGQAVTDGEDDESDFEDTDTTQVVVPDKTFLPADAFDLIFIDECHRSIYSKWRAVLDYFSNARLIGLTATPAPETLAFFDKNMVINYTLDQSIRDGVNVPCCTYTIDTLLTKEGGTIHKGEKVNETTRLNDQTKATEQKEDEQFTSQDINRKVVIPDQIKLILSEYKAAIYGKLFPQRAEADPNMDYIPKTLIFALDDKHADRIVETLREIFPNHHEKFVQKITYSAGDSKALIKSFRNDKEFRIAVTVTLVATGTDVKPIEVVMFMRDVNSELLYVQMKGRGVRTISDDALRIATPNADTKDQFYLIDAVGVTRHARKIPDAHDTPHQPRLTLEQLLERLVYQSSQSTLMDSDDYITDLYNRLVRIQNQTKPDRLEEFHSIAHIPLRTLIDQLFAALYPEQATGQQSLPITEILLPLTSNPAARNKLLEMAHGYVSTLTEATDTLVFSGFSQEDAQATTSAFENYIRTHADEVEALRIIYNNADTPLTYTLLSELRNHLLAANRAFNIRQLWNCYHILRPDVVKELTTKEERDALTNIIALVRFAYHQTTQLSSLVPEIKQRFILWCGQAQRELTPDQQSIMRQVLDYILTNGACPMGDLQSFDETLAVRLITSYSSYEYAEEALLSLSQFVLRVA